VNCTYSVLWMLQFINGVKFTPGVSHPTIPSQFVINLHVDESKESVSTVTSVWGVESACTERERP
jgi:hypothetical protein